MSFARDSCFLGDAERAGNRLASRLGDGQGVGAVTALEGRRGVLGSSARSPDGRYLYFAWKEDLEDFRLLDVAHRPQ